MNREYHCWYSPRLEREMELLVFGHAGAKVLAFPTRDGRFYEYENLGIVHALTEKIDNGHIQLFCVDSIVKDTVYCDSIHPADRIQRHIQYEEYVLNEVMPLMAEMNPYDCTITMGCSLGAYHAANLAFKHPQLFQKLCAFSGRYDLTLEVDGFDDLFSRYYDENIYFNTPTHFLPQLDCNWRLEYLRKMDIVLAIGKDDPFLENNRHLSHILTQKGVEHVMYEWDGRAHRGSAWRKMVPLYL